MPRPPQRRSVDQGLSERVFKPQGTPAAGLESLEISLDQLEALRLVDLEGLYQEAAAERMGVSRATLARSLQTARRAVAEALVEGRMLRIRGGEVDWKEPEDRPCPVHEEPRRRGRGCRCRAGHQHRGGPRARRRKEQDD